MGIGVTTEEVLLERIADGLDKLVELLTPKDVKVGAPSQPPAAADPRSGSGRRPAKKSAGKS